MQRVLIGILSLFAILTLATIAIGRPAPEPTLQEKLIGTWRLVSAKYGGQEVKFPEGSTSLALEKAE